MVGGRGERDGCFEVWIENGGLGCVLHVDSVWGHVVKDLYRQCCSKQICSKKLVLVDSIDTKAI